MGSDLWELKTTDSTKLMRLHWGKVLSKDRHNAEAVRRLTIVLMQMQMRTLLLLLMRTLLRMQMRMQMLLSLENGMT